MESDRYRPGDLEQALDSIAYLWLISCVYVGLNRPVRVGPVSLHLTLLAFSGPFLLLALNELRKRSPPKM